MNTALPIFTPAPHGDVLALIFQLAMLLLFARIFGEIALRLKQPSVVGEIMAGIFLGPSILGHFLPGLAHFAVPNNPIQGYLLETISLLGALFLLLITGFETDINLIRRQARVAFGTSIGGLSVTFISGFLLGQMIFDPLLAQTKERIIFSLFIATAMAISAIPVISKVLIEMKLIRRDIGQTILAAGMLDDTTGWIMLSVVAALASGSLVSPLTVGGSIVKVLLFLVLSFTIGKIIVRNSFHFVQDKWVGSDRLLTIVVVFMFVWAAITQSLSLEPVLGAFVIGIIIGQLPRLPQIVHEKLKSIALGIFAPIFFAVAGIKVNVINLLTPQLIFISVLVILVACFGKILGAYAGARLIGGQDHWRALGLGAALNARGAMEIIVATIGLSLGILTQEMFSIIVLMAMTTSLMAPSCLRWVLKHVHPEKEEMKRLKKEEAFKDSIIHGIHRILLPVRPPEDETISEDQIIKSRLINMMGRHNKMSITLMSVDHPEKKDNNLKFLEKLNPYFDGHDVAKRFVPSENVIKNILDEVKKDYDLLVLGATHHDKQTEYIFSTTIDPLVSLSAAPTIIVNAPPVPIHWTPKKILVPTNGSLEARNAAELAFLLASGNEEQEVVIMTVIESHIYNAEYHLNEELFNKQKKMFINMVNELRNLGETSNVLVKTIVQMNEKFEDCLLETVRKENIDLVILGTNVHTTSSRLFLGPRIEVILRKAPCPIVILNS